ncbi:MAG: hypothetical protein EBT03_02375 [Betaproteobacteria bacterium]|nr:hypothetical protein [Betaproteobacteria bacterium]
MNSTWGVGSGPYVVLPLFGSTTLRDGLSRFTVDWLALARLGLRPHRGGIEPEDPRTQ